MSSFSRNRYVKGQWHEVNHGVMLTQFIQLQGNGRVVFTKAAAGSNPTSPYDNATVITGETYKVGDVLYVSDVKVGDSLFLYPLYADVDFSIMLDGATTALNHSPAPARQHIYPSNIDESLQRIDGLEADYLYGRTLQIDAADPERAVWSFADDDISPRLDLKVFPTVSGNFYVASSNASDTSIEITCSTIDATGARVFLTATTDATNGQTPVLFGTGIDINFVFMSGDDQENLGELYFTNDGNFTAGRPDTASSVLCHVPIGYGCSPQAILKVPTGFDVVFKTIAIGLSRDGGAGGSAILHCNVKRNGGSYVVAEEWHIQTGSPTELTVSNLVFNSGSEIYFSMFSVSDLNTNVSVKALFDFVEV